MKKKEGNSAEASVANIYQLEGRVPLSKAIPFGLQHVLAMFISNMTPLIILTGIATYQGLPFTNVEVARLLQNCMIVAGIGTLIQLYPVWKIGSGLPIVMGASFAFLGTCQVLAVQGYDVMIGAIIVGGLFEGVLGLTVKYWKKFISPILSACVVVTIGLSILKTGVQSFGTSGAYPMGAPQNLIVGLFTLVVALAFHALMKGPMKQLYVIVGLLAGFLFSLCFKMVDFSVFGETIAEVGWISLPRLFHYKPTFRIDAIISLAVVFIVSAVETIGDTTAVCTGGLGRDITEKEVSGSLVCDGVLSAISGGIFGCSPTTSFSQNVGLISMTHVVNRFCIMCGAIILVLAGLFPPIGAFFTLVPNCVLGGCTVIMFGSIVLSGIKMMHSAGLNNRNTLIAATSLCLGIGVTQVTGFFDYMPKIIGNIFAGNMVAGVFVVGLVMELCLPKDPAKFE